ncbi:hypothetical protein CYCD_11790 [Tenuifilaceae bacterium CYCD]|nr:hypothetical protein CYCD_11790 [Tenuifilaceae bacterium CYCD]
MKVLFTFIMSFVVIANLQAQTTWSGVLSSSDNGIAVLSNVHDTLYQIHDGVWQKMCYLNSTDLTDMKIDNQNNIWVFYANGIKVSKDNGLTWSSISKPSDAGSIGEICGNYVYLKFSLNSSWSGNSKIYRKNYTLTNDTWKMLYEGKDITTTSDGTIYISLYDRNIIKSTDDGVTWTNTKWANVGENSTPAELNSKNNKLYVGTYWGGCYTSSDGGETWIKSQGLPSGKGVYSISLINNNVFALVKDQQSVSGYYISKDDGLTFTKLNTGFSFFVEQSIDGFSGKGNNLFISVGARGFNNSLDNGQTWSDFNNGFNNIIPHDVLRVQMDSKGVVWTLLGMGGGPNSPTWGVFKSIDNCKTWTDNTIGLYDEYQTLEDIVVTPNGDAYVSGYTSGSIYKSIDGGISWGKLALSSDPMFPQIVSSTVGILKSNGTNDTIYGCTYMDGLIRTFDGGKTWKKINSPYVYDMYSLKDTIYAILASNYTYDGIYKSINNGDTWIKKSSQVLQKITKQDNVLYGTNQSKVYKSIDDGVTWVDISLNIPTNCSINSIIIAESSQKSSDKTLIISTNAGIFSSSSATPSWQKISDITNKPIFWDYVNKKVIIGSDFQLIASSVANFYNAVNFSVVGANGTLTAKADGNTITSGILVMLGKNVVFTATPNNGYIVKEWKVNSVVVSGNQTNSYTLSNISATANVSVEFEVATGIYNPAVDGKIVKLYPNPFNSFIKITNGTDISRVEITNLTGQILGTSFCYGNEIITLDTKNLSKGIYLIRIIDSKGKINTQKMVKL